MPRGNKCYDAPRSGELPFSFRAASTKFFPFDVRTCQELPLISLGAATHELWHDPCGDWEELADQSIDPDCRRIVRDLTEGDTMDRIAVAAHFVAFVCYLNRKTKRPATPEEAGRFARQNWEAFLPYADEGLGNLITKISAGDSRKVHTAPTRRPSKTIKTGKRQFMTACYQPHPVRN